MREQISQDVLTSLNVDTLEIEKGVYDIAPEREEVESLED